MIQEQGANNKKQMQYGGKSKLFVEPEPKEELHSGMFEPTYEAVKGKADGQLKMRVARYAFSKPTYVDAESNIMPSSFHQLHADVVLSVVRGFGPVGGLS